MIIVRPLSRYAFKSVRPHHELFGGIGILSGGRIHLLNQIGKFFLELAQFLDPGKCTVVRLWRVSLLVTIQKETHFFRPQPPHLALL
jgi:hypothetical protein